MRLLYDSKSKEAILDFARKLEGSSVAEALDKNKMYGGVLLADGVNIPEKTYLGKGGFGNYLEEAYFGTINNSFSRADFEEAGLELKTAPLKRLANGQIRAKERIVLGLMDFMSIVNETFENSHFLEKNNLILLVFYFHDSIKELCDLDIPLVDIWDCIREDGTQIREDWELIVKKVREGRAHEISEGDTLYLGACTKGATRDTSQRAQPYSDLLAHARAFCFKVQYVNHIFQVLNNRKENREISYFHIDKHADTSLDQVIQKRFHPYIGMDAQEICSLIDMPYNSKIKNFYALLTKQILGAKENQQIYEFQAAGIQIKTIRIEPNGKCKESMSFKQIRYKEIITQEWEDSDFYLELTSKFFFIIFRHNNFDEPYALERVFLWNMPEKDLRVVEQVWQDTKQKIAKGIYDNFLKSSEDMIAHIRPHARDSYDLMQTPQGTMEKKKSFWLNRSYINRILIEE
jgi:DNA mismatch repair protein MutH